jgi:hypothetical protein
LWEVAEEAAKSVEESSSDPGLEFSAPEDDVEEAGIVFSSALIAVGQQAGVE